MPDDHTDRAAVIDRLEGLLTRWKASDGGARDVRLDTQPERESGRPLDDASADEVLDFLQNELGL